MPIVCEEAAELTQSTDTGVKFRTQEEMGTSILFDKEMPIENVTQFIKGYKWEVNYFLQLRNLNDVLSAPDPTLSPAVQKYHRIDGFLLTLDTPIQQEDLTTVTGSGIINAGIVPNADDVFLVNVLGGREAIFILTNVTTHSYNLHPAYYVEFKLFKFVDSDADAYNDLLLKTVKTYKYDPDHLLDYSAPIILADDYIRKVNYKNNYPLLVEYYFKHFISSDKNIIAPPTEASLYTDTMLTEFIYKVINVSDIPSYSRITRVTYVPSDINYSIWDAILQRNVDLVGRCATNIRFQYAPWIRTDPVLRPLGYVGVSFIADALEDITTASDPLYSDISDSNKPTDYKSPLSGEMTYVVSNNFYLKDENNLGTVEELLLDYLKGKLLDTKKLDYILSTYMYWTTLEQYYLLPIVIVFLKEAISNTYSEL